MSSNGPVAVADPGVGIRFIDFDQMYQEYLAEQGTDEFIIEFKYAGQTFRANMDVDAAMMLSFMETGGKGDLTSVPRLLKMIVGEETYEVLNQEGLSRWSQMQLLLTNLASELGGSGNLTDTAVS